MLEKEFELLKPEFDKIVEMNLSGGKPFSKSKFKNFIINGPRGYMQACMVKKESASMAGGTQFHVACLEPEKFDDQYFVFDDSKKVAELIAGGSKSPRSTKIYKDWKAEHLKQFEGKEEVSLKDYELMMSMSAYLRRNSKSKPVMSDLSEIEEWFDCELFGFKFCGRTDAMLSTGTFDLKRAENLNTKWLKSEIEKQGHDIEAGIYTLAKNVGRHTLLFTGGQTNHYAEVVHIEGEYLEKCQNKIELYLQYFQQCAEEDAWHEGVNYFQNNEPIKIF